MPTQTYIHNPHRYPSTSTYPNKVVRIVCNPYNTYRQAFNIAAAVNIILPPPAKDIAIVPIKHGSFFNVAVIFDSNDYGGYDHYRRCFRYFTEQRF